MTEHDIQKILDNLGQHVSKIAEENRVLKVREGALKELFTLLSNYISAEEWVNIYESTTDINEGIPRFTTWYKDYYKM